MSLAEELQRGDPLPDTVKQALTGLLSRPTDPNSVFYGSGPAAAADRRAGSTQLAAYQAGDDSCNAVPGRWVAMYSAKYSAPAVSGQATHGAFKVWTRCVGDYAGRLAAVVNMIDSVWGPMTDLMGQPLYDTIPDQPARRFGGDSAIDFYLIPKDITTTRFGASATISGLNAAVAVPAPPYQGRTSSAYVLLNEARADKYAFVSDIVHEFFHVLQDAHNQRAQFDKVGDHWEENWFTEASAKWAESHFARDSAIGQVYTTLSDFAPQRLPLDARGPQGSAAFDHEYSAFIWFYFLEQEQGPSAIANAWKAIEPADNNIQANAYLDQAFPFMAHFQDFSLRNLNDPLYKPALGKIYQDFDPNFLDLPNEKPPEAGTIDATVPSAGVATETPRLVTIDHLTAVYYGITLSSGPKQTTISIGASSTYIQAAVVMHSASHGYVLTRLSPTGATLCTDDVDFVKLVVSNGDYQGTDMVNLAASGSSQPCVAAGATVTSVTPNHVIDGTTTTVVLKGTGFTSYTHPDVILSTPGGSFADINNESVRVVSDTEIDVSGTFAAVNGYANFDVTVLDSPPAPNQPPKATCSACLVIDNV